MAGASPLSWLTRYQRSDLRGDVFAGLTTAVMLIPQSMGYALLAGLPPIVGLYASLAPLLAYAALGTSRQLAVGPVAMDSLLVAATVGAMAAVGSERYLELSIALGFLVGVLHVGLGFVRAGFVVNFLSRPVIAGFTSAAALIIATSQLPLMLGVQLPRAPVYERWVMLVRALPDAHLPTLVLAALSVAALVVLKRMSPMFPRALAVVVAATLAVVVFDLDGSGMKVVGDVPAGLPSLALPSLSMADVQALLPGALTIALVAFMETISVGSHFAKVHRYDVDANRELIAIGAANLAGAFSGGYPVAGGFSRSAVNGQAGARTQLAGVITALVVALTLLFLTPLFQRLPVVVLAAIIITAVGGLIDVAETKRLWRIKRLDLSLLALTFFATLGIGIQEGVLIGVGASLLLFVVRSTRPHFAVLGRIPGTRAYLNVERHPNAETQPGILIVRIDAQFYFGNVSFLKDTLRDLEAKQDPPVRVVILDASGINQLDSSAEAALCAIDDDYFGRGIQLLFAHVKGPVRDVMERAGFLQRLGTDRLLLDVDQAVHRGLDILEGSFTPSRDPQPVSARPAAPSLAHPSASSRYHI